MMNNNNINTPPPLFVSDIWIKGSIKNNVNVKIKKKLNKEKNSDKDEKSETSDKDDKEGRLIILFYFLNKSRLFIKIDN